MRVVKYLYSIIVFFIARSAGLGSGRPEVKPSTPEPLPLRVSRVDELGTEPHCQGEGRRSLSRSHTPLQRQVIQMREHFAHPHALNSKCDASNAQNPAQCLQLRPPHDRREPPASPSQQRHRPALASAE